MCTFYKFAYIFNCNFYHMKVTPPNIIEIGGVHCAPGKPLPQDLQRIMEEAAQVDKDNGRLKSEQNTFG